MGANLNFLKVKSTYKTAAKVQDLMGQRLCELLKTYRLKEFQRVFEFGCGTGEFSQKLQKNLIFKDYVRNDILDYKSEFEVEIFDMNHIPKAFLKTQKFNLITSNATLQWLKEDIFTNLYALLKKDGILLLSSFGQENLKEIKILSGLSLPYKSLKSHKNLLKDFEILELKEEFFKLEFESALEVFRHLKQSGVNSLGHFFLGKETLLKMQELFGNTLTYHSIYILCRKIS
ncbi:methyltransferase domain-containing protein [Campylobacter vulpis]|nr:methyltransferase domain-containing protein [Campylobacter vulpis]